MTNTSASDVSAMTNERAAKLMREFITASVFGRSEQAAAVAPLHLQAAVGQMIGLMILRYVLRIEPIASASEDDLVDLVAPTLQRYLD